MQKIIKKKSESGFSLVELMIVVGIIGVLATLALPRFKQFQAKAKAGEAKNILAHIYTLEQSYALDNNTFLAFGILGANGANNQCNPDANAANLGFRIDPCVAGGAVPRFGYFVGNASATAFVATARTGDQANNRVCPGNPTFDITLNEANVYAGTGTPATGGEVQIGARCAN